MMAILRDKCESYPHRKPVRASVCVIWNRTYRMASLGVDIKHMHLCGSHANVVANGVNQGDRWTERTLQKCAANQ
jgi:hypothetical protein